MVVEALLRPMPRFWPDGVAMDVDAVDDEVVRHHRERVLRVGAVTEAEDFPVCRWTFAGSRATAGCSGARRAAVASAV